MKMFKKITAMATALVMAVGMMSVGASANTDYVDLTDWELKFIPAPGMPSSVPIEYTLSSDYLMTTNTYSKFHSICTSYSSGTDSFGKQAYAAYRSVIYYHDKTLKTSTLQGYHYGKSSNQTNGTTLYFVDANRYFTYGDYARVFYYLKEDNGAHVKTNIKGKYKFS